MGFVSKFLASKWVTVALLFVVAAGAGWFYYQGKALGDAQGKVSQYKTTIQNQAKALDSLKSSIELKDRIVTNQAKVISGAKRYAAQVEQRVRNAEAKANRAVKECLSMHLADGLQFGPSRDAGDKDKTRSKLDGKRAGSDS